ncbi:predicted protein [Enterococcus casseliflavus EC10]|nr:predicted protein [Enterococcus casseliflavus EC10]
MLAPVNSNGHLFFCKVLTENSSSDDRISNKEPAVCKKPDYGFFVVERLFISSKTHHCNP